MLSGVGGKMDFNDRNILFLLIICCISLEGCAGKVFVPQEVTLWVEDRSAALSCQVRDSTPTKVTWSIGIDALAVWNEDVITLPNPDGKYNMTSDGLGNFVLIIKNISLSDAQNYTCLALEGVGNAQFNTSQVSVYDEPTKPYVMIDDCHGENDDEGDCHFDVFNETETRNLTCRVRHFFPNVTITWSLRGDVVEPLDVEWHLNEDGAYCGAVTITTSPQDEAYVCTATGEALRNVRTMSVGAVVQVYKASTPTYTTEESGDGDGGGGNAANIGLIVGIVIAVLFILMFVLFILYVVWVKKREGRGNFNYKYTKQKAGGTVAEDDEKRAGASKTKTEEGSKPEEQDNFRLEVEEIEDNKKSGKSKDEDTFDKSEKSPVDDAGDRGGQGGGHGDHHDHSSSGGGGSDGGGGGGGGSSHDDHGGSND